MSDDTQQQNPEPAPIPTENQNSEPGSVSVSSQEPVPDASDSASTETSSQAPETPPSSESAILDKDANPANEPLEPAPALEVPNAPNITIEKHGSDVAITEVMEPNSAEATLDKPTAQMAGNEPFDKTQDKPTDLAEEIKIKKREENLKLANEARQEKKRKQIDAILDLFAKQANLTNDEVEKLLHVSDATATRYLETLEKEGKIKQVGKTGKGVKYEKI